MNAAVRTVAPRAAHPAPGGRLARICGPAFIGLAIAGCGSVGVRPWERDLLAKPAMQLDPAPVMSAIDDHITFSKEAATGGRAFGGGGCGCN